MKLDIQKAFNEIEAAQDPIGMPVRNWEAETIWKAMRPSKKIRMAHAIGSGLEGYRGWLVRMTTEAEVDLYAAKYIIGPYNAVITSLSDALAAAKLTSAKGVVIVTYSDSRWLILAEFKV